MRIWKLYFKKIWNTNHEKLMGTKKQFEWMYGKGWYDAVKLFQDAGMIPDIKKKS